ARLVRRAGRAISAAGTGLHPGHDGLARRRFDRYACADADPARSAGAPPTRVGLPGLAQAGLSPGARMVVGPAHWRRVGGTDGVSGRCRDTSFLWGDVSARVS